MTLMAQRIPVRVPAWLFWPGGGPVLTMTGRPGPGWARAAKYRV
jgi:hypothetical protein